MNPTQTRGQLRYHNIPDMATFFKVFNPVDVVAVEMRDEQQINNVVLSKSLIYSFFQLPDINGSTIIHRHEHRFPLFLIVKPFRIERPLPNRMERPYHFSCHISIREYLFNNHLT